MSAVTHLDERGTETWRWAHRWGRVQISLTVHRHHGHLPDRWVFVPRFVFDRAASR